MKRTHILPLLAATAMVLTACGHDSPLAPGATDRPRKDGTGMVGSGNHTEADSLAGLNNFQQPRRDGVGMLGGGGRDADSTSWIGGEALATSTDSLGRMETEWVDPASLP